MTSNEPIADASAIDALAGEYWEAYLDAEPLVASLLGDHRHDLRVADRSVDADQELRRHWLDLRARVSAIDRSGLDATRRDTRDLLLAELDRAVGWIDLRLVELTWDQTQGAHAELLHAAGRLRAPDPEDAFHAVLRIDSMATMLRQAVDRFRAGIAAGRTPAQASIVRSCRQIDDYLATPLSSDPFANLPGPDDWRHTPAWQRDMFQVVRDRLRPAFAMYREALAQHLQPVARPDRQPGLVHLADGEEIYQALVRHHTGLSISPEELHAAGLDEVSRIVSGELVEIGARAVGTGQLPEILKRLRHDPSLRFQTGGEILDRARDYVDRASAAVADWFGIRPEAPCAVRRTPFYLSDAPPSYYWPPAADGSRPGEYYVNLWNPQRTGRFLGAFTAYHEAIPGHHLQLGIAAQQFDLPAFRRFSFSHTVFVEGWGLYAERLAEEMGLYEDDLDRLGMLSADVWRASRLVVDTGLHALGWTRQQAIDYMTDHVPLDPGTIADEVDRYIGMPAQALAYKVGQREILAARREASAALADSFDVKAFHDVVVGAGTVSLPVLRRRLASWLAESKEAGRMGP
ncbi:DUF885 domain-containing protein [Phytoactinopolyspora limicola]|uniref:DUF885 domain-containing protein n=1 Tax=Phytoactinopolyspora limicola TaxID=2715536 RepID=UPI00140BCCB7|nr:DUF885 domain-containing protein [Phytoactinopolyspora limicola]